MKHTILALLLIASLLVCRAQEASNPPEIQLASLIKPGVKLIYDVEAGNMKYSFTITIKDIKGGAFDWAMSAPVNKNGSVKQTPRALLSGNVLYNRFAGGAVMLDDRTTSVWLSQKVADHFNKNGGRPITVYAYGADKAPLEMGTYTGDIPVEIKVDGVTRTLNVGLAKPLVKSGKEYIVSSADEFIHYNTDPKLPLIIDMRLDFSINLAEVITKQL